MTNRSLQPGPDLENALNQTRIEPRPCLLQAIFDHLDSSPKPLYTLYLWAAKQPGFQSSAPVFNSIINILSKAREFDSAWSLILNSLVAEGGPTIISIDTFAILIRRYARAGMPLPAIRTFKFASSNLDASRNSDLELSLFEILLDSLCKEGHVRVASEYFDMKQELDPCWVPSIRIYNIVLNGWFRSRKIKRAERVWAKMRNENVSPTVVTYGTLVEGYCRMKRVERAMELVGEMRSEGIEPNAIVYNPIIDALGEAGRFKEALGMLERFSVSVTDPTVSTYNSLVKGFCKAGDLAGASKILKMLISRGLLPTPTTYNYFFRYFSKFGKIEEGMDLYTKMIESGFNPDRLTYHLMMKMLCKQERLDLAVRVGKEMRERGCDFDLATSTMLVHLLCKMHRLKEAITEIEDMKRRGIVPQYLTFQKLKNELKKCKTNEMARKLCEIMASLPHSKNLPNTFRGGDGSGSREIKTSILRKAEAMSNMLKSCNDPRELVKHRGPSENAVSSANHLIEEIKRRVDGT